MIHGIFLHIIYRTVVKVVMVKMVKIDFGNTIFSH